MPVLVQSFFVCWNSTFNDRQWSSHNDWKVQEAATKGWRFLYRKRTDSLLFSNKGTQLCLRDLELAAFATALIFLEWAEEAESQEDLVLSDFFFFFWEEKNFKFIFILQ